MADTDNDRDADYEEGSFVDRIKESPRTVSALIIILIVAAAIYAFSGDDAAAPTGETDQAAVTTQEGEPEEGDEATPAPSQAGEVAVVTSTPVTQDQLKDEAAKLPEPRKTDNAYVEVAQAGEGTTHLTRRATTRWLSENQAGYNVTNEHRIYIEDYLKDRIGSEGLSLGQEHSISFELVQEAVNAAKELNENQLHNLTQYTHALSV